MSTMKQTSEIIYSWKERRRGINTVKCFPRKDSGKKLGEKTNYWLAGISPKNPSSVFELGHSFFACLTCDQKRWGMVLGRPKYTIFKYRKMIILFLLCEEISASQIITGEHVAFILLKYGENSNCCSKG